jgi:plastocyanin
MHARTVFAVLVAGVFASSRSHATSPVAPSCTSADVTVNATDQMNFDPSAITITRGQTVCWQNKGTLNHTVTADDSSFNASLEPGQSFTHTFHTPGAFGYSCRIHDGMTGGILVN